MVEMRRTLVGVRDPSLRIENQDGILRLIQQGGLFQDAFVCLLLRRHVLLYCEVVRDLAFSVAHGRDDRCLPKELSVLFPVQELPAPLASIRDRVPQFAVCCSRGPTRLQQPRICSQRFLCRVARDLCELLAHVLDLTAEVRNHDGGWALLHGTGKLSQLIFGLLTPANVSKNTLDQGSAGPQMDGAGGDFYPDLASVGRDHVSLHEARLWILEVALEYAAVRFRFLRRMQLRLMQAYDLFLGPVEQAGRLAIRVEDRAGFGISQENRIPSALEHRYQSIIRGLKQFLGSPKV